MKRMTGPVLMAALMTMGVQAEVDPDPVPSLAEEMHMPDFDGPVLKELQKRVAEKGAWAKAHADIVRPLQADDLSLGKWKAKVVDQLFKPGKQDEEKWLYPYEVRRRYELIQVVMTEDGKRTGQRVVAQCNLSAKIVRQDRLVDEKYSPVTKSVELKYEWMDLNLQERPQIETQVYYGWPQKGVKPPLVEVIEDEKTYFERFGSFYSMAEKKRKEVIDFEKNQVVLAYWGWKPAAQYGLKVEPAYGTSKETVIRIRTIVPYGIADPLEANPAVAVVIPRCERVKVVIGGDRIPAKWGKDFSPMKSEALEVLVPLFEQEIVEEEEKAPEKPILGGGG